MSNNSIVSSLQKARLMVDYGIILLIFVVAFQVTISMADLVARGDAYGDKNGTYIHIDFIDFYSIGHLLRSSEKLKLYDPATQLKFYNEAIAPSKIDKCFFVQSPPHYLLCVSPLSLLPLKDALFLWNTISIGLASVALFCLRKMNGKLRNWEIPVVIAATMASLPSADSLMNGQAAWFFLAVFAFFSYAFIANKQIIAGLALAVISFKPHYFVLLMIPSLIGKRFKMMLAAAVAIIVMLSLSAMIVGWENVLFYPRVLLQAEGNNNFAGLFPEKMICLRGILSLLLERDLALHLSFAAYLAGLFATGCIWYLSLVKKLFSNQWATALMIMIMLVTSPHLHLYDCILVALPAALTLPTIRFSKVIFLREKSLRVWTLTLMLYPISTWFFMLLAPKIGSMILPRAAQTILTTNGQNCGLLSFYCYLALNIFLIAIGMWCALNDKKSKVVEALPI